MSRKVARPAAAEDRPGESDVVLVALTWRLRYKLSFRDVTEPLLHRGYEVTHETILSWEFRFAPLLADGAAALCHSRPCLCCLQSEHRAVTLPITFSGPQRSLLVGELATDVANS